jgi:branched-chain amino acid transport system substrate-binding protein
MKTSNASTAIAAALFTLCLSAAAPADEYGLATNLSLTGSWANYGVGMQNSFRLAIDQANASGALGANKIRLIPGDNAGTATQAVSLATKAGADPNRHGRILLLGERVRHRDP